ncbi:MAG: CPBP family intramembrane metalloprotease [Clostridia bacterium]|nr:CPBP family intramembrane metalloprotease [Clostridia bacterium]
MKNEQVPARISPLAAVSFLLFAQVFLSLLAGTVDGGVGRILFMLSYLIPIVLFAFLVRRQGLVCALTPTRVGFTRVLPLLPIFLTAVLLTSTATAAIMNLLGADAVGGMAEGGGFLPDLITDCVFPAVLEEGLMRFAVLSLLLLWNERHAIWISALLFALLHASIYQLPYAFVGGLFLSLATVWGGSPVWAVLFHFVSNLLSLFMQYAVIWWGEKTGLGVSLALSFVLFLLAAIGLLVLLKRDRTPKREKIPTDWRSLLLSPLPLWALMMLILTVL